MSSEGQQLSEREKALRGEHYYAFTPELISMRGRCHQACQRFNQYAGTASRREQVKLIRDVFNDKRPLPPPAEDPEAEEQQFKDDPIIEPLFKVDYGTNVTIGKGVYINFNCVILDTCHVTIGDNALLGPTVNIYAASHPVDPAIRKGTNGPENGKEVHIGADCWIGGNVTICPGVTIGRGSTVGAGSVVTKSIPPFVIAAGNPARVLRKIETEYVKDEQKESGGG